MSDAEERKSEGACGRCAEPGYRIEIERDGKLVATGILCDACLADSTSQLAQMRVEFDALIESGLTPDEANAMMIAKLSEKLKPS